MVEISKSVKDKENLEEKENEKDIDIIHSHALRSYQEDIGAIFTVLCSLLE